MNSTLKRLQAVGLALLLLPPSLVLGAQNNVPKQTGRVYTDYGLETEMRIPSRIMRSAITKLPRRMRVPALRASRLIFSQAGGIMFDAPAQPCDGLAGVRLRLSYDRAQPDGRRLTLHVGARRYTVNGVYDRELRPIAEFANDSVPVLTNVQYPDEATHGSCSPPSSLKVVTLHPAFLDTRLGRLLAGMDSVPWSFSRGERWDSREALPAATVRLSESLASALREDNADYAAEWPEVRRRLVNAGTSELRALTADEKRHYAEVAAAWQGQDFDWEQYEARILSDPGIDKAAWATLSVNDRRILLAYVDSLRRRRVSNFNDDDAPPSFCTLGSAVTLGGSPRLEFIAPWYVNNYSLPSSSRLMTENLSRLRLVDQEGYDGLLKIYRLSGLFRYVKGQSRQSWRQFFMSLPPKERQETYTIVCPDCKRADVEAWLACVESESTPTARRRGARRTS